MTLDADERLELATKWQLRSRVLTLESTLTAQSKQMAEIIKDARQTVKRAQAAHERLDEFADNDAVMASMMERLEAVEKGQAELADKVQKLRDWAVEKFKNGSAK
jgi:hypothetical protein